MLNDITTRLHQLIWRPGLSLHQDWWQAWQLSPFAELYPQVSPLSQQAIDRQIIGQRQTRIEHLPAPTLTDRQLALLRAMPRLPLLLKALGLLAFGCAGYFSYRDYRQVLSRDFSDAQLNQIRLLLREQHNHAVLPAESLPETALQTGMALLDKAFEQDIVWLLLRPTLPRSSATVDVGAYPVHGLSLFLRLERFL